VPFCYRRNAPTDWRPPQPKPEPEIEQHPDDEIGWWHDWHPRKIHSVEPAKTRTCAKPKPKRRDGYKEHFAGSRKGAVHRLFDRVGAEKALHKAVRLGIKPDTAKGWIREWKREMTVAD
jgi:hypothetical protein